MESKFRYDITVQSQSVATKRSILKRVTAVYDPLGRFSPLLLETKLLIQQLWKLKVEWDEEIPNELDKKWTIISDS